MHGGELIPNSIFVYGIPIDVSRILFFFIFMYRFLEIPLFEIYLIN